MNTMKHLKIVLVALVATASAACVTDPDKAEVPATGANTTNKEIGATPGSTTGSGTTTFDHNNDSTGDMSGNNDNGTNTKQKTVDESAVGPADIVARLHTCGKLPVAVLQRFLASRGVNGQGKALFDQGRSALQDANYAARIPEAAFGSTASYAKMSDVFVAAAADIRMNLDKSTGCPGIKMVAADKFTKDGVSCIVGLPVSDAYMVAVNLNYESAKVNAEATTSNPAKSKEDVAQELIIASLLTAAHACN
jgi:hypothetical protein